MKPALLALLLALPAACLAAPGPPDEYGGEMVAALEEGRSGDAARAYDRIEWDERFRDRLYPVLFGAARRHYEAGRLDEALAVLRFMEPRYGGSAVRTALVQTLFRRYAETPSEGLRRELSATIAELSGEGAEPSAWVELAATQIAIDEGRTADARGRFDRFLARWEGGSEEIALYAEDIGRRLASL